MRRAKVKWVNNGVYSKVFNFYSWGNITSDMNLDGIFVNEFEIISIELIESEIQ